MREWILASKSPRRRELLQHLNESFSVLVHDTDETIEDMSPSDTVCELSKRKAMAVFENELPNTGNTSNKLVIGSDTVVAYGDNILGKPKDKTEAFAMLMMLQGNVHEVYTGVTLIWDEEDCVKTHTFFACTRVTFYPMTEDEINAYIATGDCFDKAGAYGVQSKAAPFVKEIEGDYNNVVGLPVAMLYQELKQLDLM